MANKDLRNYRIDILKAIAIIAVVFYHFGGNWFPYGYLGVDIFLVISGYMMMHSIVDELEDGRFSFIDYMIKRICRLALPTYCVVVLALLVGYFVFLPENYKTLCENGVATVLFANNILENIISKDYWNIANVFKPLMHTWYLGILMQAYFVISIISFIISRYLNNKVMWLKKIMLALTVISFILYLLPFVEISDKFYQVQYRLFEITVGCCIYFRSCIIEKFFTKFTSIVSAVALIVLLFSNIPLIAPKYELLIVVLCTVILIVNFRNTEEPINKYLEYFSYVGKSSLSIYLCHQLIIAFVFSSIIYKHNIYLFIGILSLTTLMSFIMYRFIETNTNVLFKARPKFTFALTIIMCLSISSFGIKIYMDSGIVRDVPELNISKEDYNWPMKKEKAWNTNELYAYVNAPRKWENKFSDDYRKKVLVIGNSYARDWCNILNESKYKNDIQIYYLECSDKEENVLLSHKEDIEKADIVFVAMEILFSKGHEVGIPSFFINNIPKEKLYIIGDKNFGSNNNQVYINRKNTNYYNTRVKQDTHFLAECKNENAANYFGDHYIDMMGAVENQDSMIRVFSDDQKFISWDCRHLTKSGAVYYAQNLDLAWIIQ